MERDFQKLLLAGCALYEGFAYKIPDNIAKSPFRGSTFSSGGKKPFDIVWILPGMFAALELKQCHKQSWNICKENDSGSLKEHQFDCLEATALCGHMAVAIINFKFNPSLKFKKKYPQFKKPVFDAAYAVPIADLIAERANEVDTLPLEWFWNKGYDLVKKRIDGVTLWDPGSLILSKEVDDLNAL